MTTIYERIWEAVSRIPIGTVMTYGDIAKLAHTHPRVVGNALHRNPDPTRIPCHRVVHAQGELSQAFAFGGTKEQAKRLKQEGVAVTASRVDLKEYRK